MEIFETLVYKKDMDAFKKDFEPGTNVDVSILNSDELVGVIYKGENVPKDNRFLRHSDGGVFRYFDIRTLNQENIKNDLKFVVLKENDLIVGISCLQKDPWKENNFWVTGISVDSKYQGKGYGRKLCEATVDFAVENGVSLQPSTYKEEGEVKLKHILEEEAKKKSVVLAEGR